MKIAYLCPYAHVTVLNKSEEVTGRIPSEIICAHLNCGCPSAQFPFLIDEAVPATHEFFSNPVGVLSTEEIQYLNAGGLLFRTIEGNVPEEVKKEFVATEGITKLATFIIKSFPEEERLPDVIDTTISLLKKFRGHLSLMKTLKGKTPGGRDLN